MRLLILVAVHMGTLMMRALPEAGVTSGLREVTLTCGCRDDCHCEWVSSLRPLCSPCASRFALVCNVTDIVGCYTGNIHPCTPSISTKITLTFAI